METFHPATNPDFKFRVKQTFKSAVVRQVSEAVMIRRKGGAVINSKGVYNRCTLPRLTVENPEEQDPLQEEQNGNDGHDHHQPWKEMDTTKRMNEEREGGRKSKRRRKDHEDGAGVTNIWGEQEAQKPIAIENFLKSKDTPTKRGKGKQTKLRFQSKTADRNSTDDSKPPLPVNLKRKNGVSYEEFQRDCKRLRPVFSQEEELEQEFDKESTTRLDGKSNKQQIIFFSIFSKTNAKLNQEIMFRKTRKPKLSSSKRKAEASSGNSKDIRTFLQTKPKPKHSTIQGEINLGSIRGESGESEPVFVIKDPLT